MSQLSNVKHSIQLLARIKADAYSIGIFEDGSLTSRGKSIDDLLNGQVSSAYERGDMKGKPGETTLRTCVSYSLFCTRKSITSSWLCLFNS